MNESFFEFCYDQSGITKKVLCRVRKSKRAKRINLKIQSRKKIILTLPYSATWQEGNNFLNEQTEWLEKRIKKFPELVCLSQYFSSDGQVWLTQYARSIQWNLKGNYSRLSHEVSSDKININIPIGCDLEDSIFLTLKNIAKENLSNRIEILSKNVSLKYQKIRIGNQISRWGSCSIRKTISLNWRLVLLPYEIGNYVIFHELAHLKHLNHSKEFWDFLELICPGARRLDTELRTVGRSIISLHQGD